VAIPQEACPLNLAPTASTTAMLAMGDALAMAISEKRGFREEDFAALHPGGRLGRRFLKVRDLMRTGDRIPVVTRDTPMTEAIHEMSRKMMGVTAVVNGRGELAGVISDGDLRRLLEKDPTLLTGTAGDCSHAGPKTVLGEARDYLTIRIIASEMTLMVPADATDAAGLRAVITGDDLDAVLALLRGEDEVIAGNWNRRFKHNREKMRTGDVLELVGVIRNLMNRSIEKGLSSGERQMMARAKRILASEIQYAKDLDEAEAQAYLDELLEEIALERETAASRAAK